MVPADAPLTTKLAFEVDCLKAAGSDRLNDSLKTCGVSRKSARLCEQAGSSFPPPPTVRSAAGSAERDLGWHVDLRRVTQGRVKDELVNPAGLITLPPTPDRLDRAQHAPGQQRTRNPTVSVHSAAPNFGTP